MLHVNEEFISAYTSITLFTIPSAKHACQMFTTYLPAELIVTSDVFFSGLTYTEEKL
jgi:hypothetical protein